MECSRVLCDPTPARDRWHCVRGGQVAGGLLPCATHVWCFADRWSTSGELAPSFLLPLASHTAREEHLFPLVTSILISLVSGTQIIQREREGKKERISEIILMQRPFQVITSHSRLKKKTFVKRRFFIYLFVFWWGWVPNWSHSRGFTNIHQHVGRAALSVWQCTVQHRAFKDIQR